MTPEQFFVAARAEPFEWERHSCAHLMDRWCQMRTGKSFIAAYGADCSTETLAADLMARTALPIMVARAMRRLGFLRTKTPQAGDAGIILIGHMATCSIRGSRMWLFRGDEGFGALPDARIIAAWSLQ